MHTCVYVCMMTLLDFSLSDWTPNVAAAQVCFVSQNLLESCEEINIPQVHTPRVDRGCHNPGVDRVFFYISR